MELIKIIKYLNKKFNSNLAAKWDYSGFQIINQKTQINPDKNIEKIIVCLDVNEEVVDRAIKENVDLIISRHPFIFGELKNELKNKAKNNMIKKLNENDIYIFSIHTNYDASPNQIIVDLFAEHLEIKTTKRCGEAKECINFKFKKEYSSKDIYVVCQKIFKNDWTFVNTSWNDDFKIKELFLTSGAGGSSMIGERMNDSLFITGEVKWNEWIYANDNNINVISLGHYMENYFIDDLYAKLSNSFVNISVDKVDISNQFKKRG